MLRLASLTLRRGPRILFQDVSITVHSGQNVGITGANGSGKSSLFALIRNEISLDSGDISLPPNTVISHVAQETPALDCSAIDYVLDGDKELRILQEKLSVAEAANDGMQVATLHDQLNHIDAWTANARAARLLNGTGFTTEQENLPVSSFSGGWRMRLNLAQALMCRSDLLLLDEPTNHLDLDAVFWLEDWLTRYAGTLLLISHDRDFLDRCVQHIAHIEQQGIKSYSGNYSEFEKRRAEQLAQQQSSHERQQREIKHIQSYVERFRAKATKARQAQSRLKALSRMELIAPAHVDSPFHFEFRQADKIPQPLLQLSQASAGYGTSVILDNLNLSLAPGQRIGLLGRNGAGKSTFIKLISESLQLTSVRTAGELTEAQDLKIGYFAQHQLEQIDPTANPLLLLQRLDKKAREQDLRKFLGGFGFNGDRVLEEIAPFSGGEKARLVLAMIVYQKPNLLLLDEPTNHLDLEMRHALTVALQGFEGAMIVVSHDRYLLRSVADELWLVADKKVTPFTGDLEDYHDWLASQRRDSEGTGNPSANTTSISQKEQRRLNAEQRKQTQQLKKEVQKQEKLLDKLNLKKLHLDETLSDNTLYEAQSKDRLKQLLQEQAELKKEIAITEENWLAASENLETGQENT